MGEEIYFIETDKDEAISRINVDNCVIENILIVGGVFILAYLHYTDWNSIFFWFDNR